MSITREQVLQMDWKAIQVAIKAEDTKTEMQNLLRDRAVVSYVSKLMLEAKNKEEELDAQLERVNPPSTEVLAAQATEMAAAEPVVEPAAPVTPPPPVELEPTRIVREYQVRDEDGTPIGRPTHLEARTMDEMLEKMQTAHENATRAFHRLKKQKLTFKNDKTILTPEQIQEAARVALESKDASKASDVIREVIETSYKQREEQLRQQKYEQDGVAISNTFMRRHLHDYNPCEANKLALGEYFRDHNLEFTLDNLEAAFQDLKEQGDKLASVESVATKTVVAAANPVAATTVATPVTPVIPVAETPATVLVSETPAQPLEVVAPVVAATAPTPAAPNQQPAARRPGVNGSLPPGTLSAQRPGTPDPALARSEFLKVVKNMDAATMKAKLKNDPQFVKQLTAYGIKVR